MNMNNELLSSIELGQVKFRDSLPMCIDERDMSLYKPGDPKPFLNNKVTEI